MNVKKKGGKRKVVGFMMEEERAFPRHGYEIRMDGERLGHVTSGTISPGLEKGVRLGYVASGASSPGSELNVVIRGRQVRARINSVQFIKKEGNSGADPSIK